MVSTIKVMKCNHYFCGFEKMWMNVKTMKDCVLSCALTLLALSNAPVKMDMTLPWITQPVMVRKLCTVH